MHVEVSPMGPAAELWARMCCGSCRAGVPRSGQAGLLGEARTQAHRQMQEASGLGRADPVIRWGPPASRPESSWGLKA